MELKGVMLRCEELLAQVLETDKTHLKKEKVGAGGLGVPQLAPLDQMPVLCTC